MSSPSIPSFCLPPVAKCDYNYNNVHFSLNLCTCTNLVLESVLDLDKCVGHSTVLDQADLLTIQEQNETSKDVWTKEVLWHHSWDTRRPTRKLTRRPTRTSTRDRPGDQQGGHFCHETIWPILHQPGHDFTNVWRSWCQFFFQVLVLITDVIPVQFYNCFFLFCNLDDVQDFSYLSSWLTSLFYR